MSKNQWSLARRRGWLRPSNDEQSLAWRDYCFSNNMDCLTATHVGAGFRLTCTVHPDHPFSELGYLELKDMLKSLACSRWSMGGWAGSAGEFSLRLPDRNLLEDVVEQVRAILRRDRTPRRRVELQGNASLQEGLAYALDLEALWDDHQSTEAVYVMEMEGRPGRCLVFKHLKPPLVDLPLSSFQILASPDA